jgi:predicted nuclease of predicted toxin-antitoxin system
MKLLLDENVSWRLAKLLADIFPYSVHVTDVLLKQPATDADIWNFARQNNFIILTQDEDFEAIALLRGHPPKIVLLRAGNLSTKGIEELLRSRLALIRAFIEDTEKVLLELY